MVAIHEGDSVQTRWIEGFSGMHKVFIGGRADRVTLDPGRLLPERNRYDNEARTRGPFKTWKLPAIRFFGGFDTERPQWYVVPVAGWNNYNKTMAGFALYNKFIPNRDFEFMIAPMFAPRTGDVVGSAGMTWTIYFRASPFHHIDLSASVKHYAYDYARVRFADSETVFWRYVSQPAAARFVFRSKDHAAHKRSYLELGNVSTWQDESLYDGVQVRKENQFRSYQFLTFRHRNERKLDPYQVTARMERGEGFVKGRAAGRYIFSYRDGEKGISIRGGMEAFLHHDTNNPLFNLRLSSNPGYYDYLYAGTFLGRSETSGIWSQQLMNSGGGFRILSAVGSSDEWIAFMNLEADFPGRIPVSLFFDVGSYSGAWDDRFERQKIVYDAGVSVKLLPGVLEVHVPLVKSADIKEALELQESSFANQIRFLFSLEGMNPFRLRDQAFK